MCKILSTIFFTLIFSLNLQADDKPEHWMEREDTKSNKDSKETFLDETRLLCVSEGYKQITGDTPSHMYLSAIAMRARVDGKLADKSIRLTKTDEITYDGLDIVRKDYLSKVAQHTAMSGACVDDDISDTIDKLDYTNLVKVIDLPDSLLETKGEDAGKYNVDKLNRLAQKLTAWNYVEEDDTSDLRKLFPLKMDNTIFTKLTYEQKQKLLRDSYAKYFRTDGGSFKYTPTTDKFVNCYNKIEGNRQKGAIKTASRGEKAPSDICRSIQIACGYQSDASFCGGFPGAAQPRPCNKQPPLKPCYKSGGSSDGSGTTGGK